MRSIVGAAVGFILGIFIAPVLGPLGFFVPFVGAAVGASLGGRSSYYRSSASRRPLSGPFYFSYALWLRSLCYAGPEKRISAETARLFEAAMRSELGLTQEHLQQTVGLFTKGDKAQASWQASLARWTAEIEGDYTRTLAQTALRTAFHILAVHQSRMTPLEAQSQILFQSVSSARLSSFFYVQWYVHYFHVYPPEFSGFGGSFGGSQNYYSSAGGAAPTSSMSLKEAYQEIGGQERESQESLQKKYRKLVFKYHPDRQNGKSAQEKQESEKRFKRVQESWELIKLQNNWV